jgi:hypothetical protein
MERIVVLSLSLLLLLSAQVENDCAVRPLVLKAKPMATVIALVPVPRKKKTRNKHS